MESSAANCETDRQRKADQAESAAHRQQQCGMQERKPALSQGNEMDYYEKLQDRADNQRESKQLDEDTAYEMLRQRDLDNAAAFYEVAVMKEAFERRAAA